MVGGRSNPRVRRALPHRLETLSFFVLSDSSFRDDGRRPLARDENASRQESFTPAYFQVSVRVAEPEAGVVKRRLAPLSHVTFPLPSFLMYLYSMAVEPGRLTVPLHAG